MSGERVNIFTVSCVRYITGKKLLYNTRSQAWCSVMTWMSGMVGGESLKRERYMYNYG